MLICSGQGLVLSLSLQVHSGLVTSEGSAVLLWKLTSLALWSLS